MTSATIDELVERARGMVARSKPVGEAERLSVMGPYELRALDPGCRTAPSQILLQPTLRFGSQHPPLAERFRPTRHIDPCHESVVPIILYQDEHEFTSEHRAHGRTMRIPATSLYPPAEDLLHVEIAPLGDHDIMLTAQQ